MKFNSWTQQRYLILAAIYLISSGSSAAPATNVIIDKYTTLFTCQGARDSDGPLPQRRAQAMLMELERRHALKPIRIPNIEGMDWVLSPSGSFELAGMKPAGISTHFGILYAIGAYFEEPVDVVVSHLSALIKQEPNRKGTSGNSTDYQWIQTNGNQLSRWRLSAMALPDESRFKNMFQAYPIKPKTFAGCIYR